MRRAMVASVARGKHAVDERGTVAHMRAAKDAAFL